MHDPRYDLSWDDLRIIQSIGRTGAVAMAAEMLGINTSTIARRLAKAEETLGVTLFDRRRTGYLATSEGEEMIALAGRVELDVISVTRRVSSRMQGHAGDLRITTSDSILHHFLTPIIADFKAINPEIRVETIVGNHTLNLARGESDIAVRATNNPPENLFGRKVATIAWAPYGRLGDLVQSTGTLERQWISYCGDLSGLRAVRVLEENVSQDDITYRTGSVAGVAAAIAAGMGAGFLPCMLGDLMPELTRIGEIEPLLSDDLWLLTHPDIRKSGRVCAFMSHCIDAISKRRGLIEGLERRDPAKADGQSAAD